MPTALITGANRGLGFEFCKQFLNKKYQVYACCRNINNATELQKLKSISHNQLEIIPLDVEAEESINLLNNHIKHQPIDILINNAGIFTDYESDNHLIAKTWQKFFMINSIAPYLITQKLLENCRASDQKKIINITSGLGSIKQNTEGGYDPYRASKAALNAITKSLAIENSSNNIIVIAMSPGWVRTDMGGAGAPLSPEEAVSGIIKQIDKLTAEDTGKFYSYDGRELPW